MAMANTVVQSTAPDELRGRVMSVYIMVSTGVAPLGALWPERSPALVRYPGFDPAWAVSSPRSARSGWRAASRFARMNRLARVRKRRPTCDRQHSQRIDHRCPLAVSGFSRSSISSWRRFLLQFIPRRKEIFDNNFTPYDRSMLGQAAFFILLPGLGRAARARVTPSHLGDGRQGARFRVLSSSLGMFPTIRAASQMCNSTLIAFAGTFVNLLLIVLALAVVFLKKPPLRAPWNELLLQFVFISGINALIFYPLMDLVLNISGDWSQMYRSGVPWLTAIIVIIQVAFIAAGWWGMHNEGMRKRIAKFTGLPSGASMRMGFGGGGKQAVRKVETHRRRQL